MTDHEKETVQGYLKNAKTWYDLTTDDQRKEYELYQNACDSAWEAWAERCNEYTLYGGDDRPSMPNIEEPEFAKELRKLFDEFQKTKHKDLDVKKGDIFTKDEIPF